MFIIIYNEDTGYVTNLPLNGRLTVQTSPFEIEYTVYFENKITRINPFEKDVATGNIIRWRPQDGKPISSIDGLLMHDYGIIKVEVIKGIIYLQDRPLQDYFYDPENISSKLPPFSTPPPEPPYLN